MIDPIDLLPHNNAAGRAFMLSIILFSTIVNDINFCAITFIQSIHEISLLSPRSNGIRNVQTIQDPT